MNLFISALFSGKMQSTDKYERLIQSIPAMIKRYRDVEQSAEYKEYCELDKLVHSKEFLATKKKYQTTAYKDTEEGKTMTRYKKAADSLSVRRHEFIENSEFFKEYLEFTKDPVRYAELKDKKALKSSAFLRKMYLFDHSLSMKSFRADEQSHEMKDYLQLKDMVADPDFVAREAFWKNSKRWETTEEAKKEARYKELYKNEDIQYILKTDEKDIIAYERYEKVYFDNFDWINMKQSDWKPGFHYLSKDFKSVHSYTNEVQAFNEGKNTDTKDGALVITTRKEHVTAPAWDSKKGMVMHDFEYTSDVINNAGVLALEEGSVISVKARCTGLLNHGIYLRSDKHVPFISIFDFSGLRMHCGLKSDIKKDAGKKELDRWFPITYMIFTVIWEKDEIVWYINNMEVHRCKNEIPKGEKLYLHMYSFAFKSAKMVTDGKLEVDWVMVAKQK